MLYNNVTVVGIGNEARQGKDTSASYLKSLIGKNVYILHFADGLYEEINNKHRIYPLVEVLYYDGQLNYHLNTINNVDGNILYTNIYDKSEVPLLHNIFLAKSKISNELTDDKIYQKLVYTRNTEFWGQNEKMPRMLQFWGTDFRRNKCSENYWVNDIDNKINEILKSNTTDDHLYIFLPDTRFINEYEFIKKFKNSYTLKVIRMISSDKQFIDLNRDPNHPSECSLKNVNFDYTISALNLDELFSKLDEFYKIINTTEN